jgi:hypothetical protein
VEEQAPAASEEPKPAPSKKPTTNDLFSRPFAEANPPSEGENLQFDFDDELPHLDELEEAAAEAISPPPPPPKRPSTPQRPAAPKRKTTYAVEARDTLAPGDHFEIGDPDFTEPPRPQFKRNRAQEDSFIDESEAPVYNTSATHSARFFLALLLLVGLGFGLMTLLIHGAPATARELLNRLPGIGTRFASPITPAQMVVLHDVHSHYEANKNGRAALVIEGEAENVTGGPLHTIRISARLNAGSPGPNLAKDVFCGNSIGQQTISQMTPHEVDFFQQLHPPENFTLPAAASCPFVVVFLDPPTASRVSLSIAEAKAAPEENNNPSSES